MSLAHTNKSTVLETELPKTSRSQRSPSLSLTHEAVTDSSSILSLPSPLAPIAEPELPSVLSSLPPLPMTVTSSNSMEPTTTGSFKLSPIPPSFAPSLSPPPTQSSSLDVTVPHRHEGRRSGGSMSRPIASTSFSRPHQQSPSDGATKNTGYTRSSSSSSTSPILPRQPTPSSTHQSGYMLSSSLTLPPSLPPIPVSLSTTPPAHTTSHHQQHQSSSSRRDVMYQGSHPSLSLTPSSSSSPSLIAQYYSGSTGMSQLPLQRNASSGVISPTHQQYGHSHHPSTSIGTNSNTSGRIVPTCTPLPINIPSINQGFGFTRMGGPPQQQAHPQKPSHPPMQSMLSSDMQRGGSSYMSRSNSAGGTMVTPSLPSLPSFTPLNVPFPSSTAPNTIIPASSSSTASGSSNLSLFPASLYPYTQFVVPAQMNPPFPPAGLQMPAQPNPAMAGYPYIPGMSHSLYNTQVTTHSFTR